MEKIIITKQNGKYKKTMLEENKKIKQKTTVVESLALEDYKDIKNDIFSINKYLKAALKKEKENNKNVDIYTNLMLLIKNNNTSEILNYIKNLKISFDQTKNYLVNIESDKKFKNLLNNYPDILVKIISKIIIENYINLILSKLSNDQIYSLYLKILSQEDLSHLINTNEEYKELTTAILINKINYIYQNRFKHLCWENCENLLVCDKIQDNLKGLISNYKFIKDGYQIIVKKKNVHGKEYYKTDCFYVTKCDNYVKKKEKTRIN